MSYDFVHGIAEADLLRLKRRLEGLRGRTTPIAYVAVFGSRVKGTSRADSDLDVVLALLSGAKEAKASPRWKRIIDSIQQDFKSSQGIALDLNIFDVEEIGPKTLFKPSELHKL